MSFDPQVILHNHKDKIVMTALIISGLKFLGWLWEELPILGKYTLYFYLAIIALSIYIVLTYYWGKNYGASPVKHQAKVSVRDFSRPPPVPPARKNTEKKIFDVFNKN